MSWWGTLIGGTFGFMLGGPLGALIGGALGRQLGQGLRQAGTLRDGRLDPRERVQAAFFTATFSVMGHIAKADGVVTAEEIRLAAHWMDQLDLQPAQKELARTLFRQGKAPDFPLHDVLAQIGDECGHNHNLLALFIQIQLQAAYADGSVHAQERAILDELCHELGVDVREFAHYERIIGGHNRAGENKASAATTRMSISQAYAVLGIEKGLSDAEVKTAYRRLISENHPDKLVSQGLPEEMMTLATERTQEIQQAYDTIKEARGL